MQKMFSLSCVILASVFAMPVVGHAQATRTWVSGTGNDANPCSRTAPCKTFAGAISKTAAHGEIDVLDPGGFGAVTITKSISIISDSIEAGVLVSGTNGIIVNAAATDVIELHGLNLDGLGTSLDGIRILQAGAVHIRKSQIRGFSLGTTNSAIAVAPTANPVKVFVSDVTIVQNKQGVFVSPATGVAATVLVDRAVIVNNPGPAIRSLTGGTVRVTNSVIAGNAKGVQQGGSGLITSFGNNSLLDNGVDGTFDATTPLK